MQKPFSGILSGEVFILRTEGTSAVKDYKQGDCVIFRVNQSLLLFLQVAAVGGNKGLAELIRNFRDKDIGKV